MRCSPSDDGVEERQRLALHVEETILALPRILINGGRRGYLVGIDPRALIALLDARPVRCAES